MTERSTSESWAEYRRLVLAAIERHEGEIEALRREKGELETRLTQTERLSAALRLAVFGDGQNQSVATRLALLDKFVKDHPSLSKDDPADPSTKKPDKRMILLLVGAVSGLIALLGTALEIIGKLLGG